MCSIDIYAFRYFCLYLLVIDNFIVIIFLKREAYVKGTQCGLLKLPNTQALNLHALILFFLCAKMTSIYTFQEIIVASSKNTSLKVFVKKYLEKHQVQSLNVYQFQLLISHVFFLCRALNWNISCLTLLLMVKMEYMLASIITSKSHLYSKLLQMYLWALIGFRINLLFTGLNTLFGSRACGLTCSFLFDRFVKYKKIL